MTMAISSWKASRRSLLLRASALGITSLVRLPAQAGVGDQPSNPSSNPKARKHMSKIITKDGTEIYYKDWGTGQPIVFHHGWPLSADDWDSGRSPNSTSAPPIHQNRRLPAKDLKLGS